MDLYPPNRHLRRRFRAKYDHDPALAQEERSRIIAEAADHGHLLLLYHSPEQPAA